MSSTVKNWCQSGIMISKKIHQICKLERPDIARKEIIVAVHNSPVGICGNSASYNNKAARLLSELYGSQCPAYWCSAHICDGTVKRLPSSKTMSVAGIKECNKSPCLIVKNFSYSMKNKERLDQTMKTLVPNHKHARNKTDTEVLQGIKDSLANIRQITLTYI